MGRTSLLSPYLVVLMMCQRCVHSLHPKLGGSLMNLSSSNASFLHQEIMQCPWSWCLCGGVAGRYPLTVTRFLSCKVLKHRLGIDGDHSVGMQSCKAKRWPHSDNGPVYPGQCVGLRSLPRSSRALDYDPHWCYDAKLRHQGTPEGDLMLLRGWGDTESTKELSTENNFFTEARETQAPAKYSKWIAQERHGDSVK